MGQLGITTQTELVSGQKLDSDQDYFTSKSHILPLWSAYSFGVDNSYIAIKYPLGVNIFLPHQISSIFTECCHSTDQGLRNNVILIAIYGHLSHRNSVIHSLGQQGSRKNHGA